MEFGFAGRMLAGLAVLVVVLFALQIVARAGWRTRLTGVDRRLMSIVETLALPNAAALHVIKIADRYYVFARTGTQIANLCEIPASDVDRWTAGTARTPAVTPLATLAANLRWPLG